LPRGTSHDERLEFPWSRWIANFRKPRPPIRTRHGVRPRLEALEDRLAPAVYNVTNVNDAGAGSLRQAILDANNNGGADTINVAILGAPGPKTITLQSALPTITEGVTIDATTQAGWAGNPIVELNGNNVAFNAFNVDTSDVTIRGWVINQFLGSGIVLDNTNDPGAGNNVIEGNYIGTDINGEVTPQLDSNGGYGIAVYTSDNYIGGPGWMGNVIAGNGADGVSISFADAHRNTLEGNFIGIGADGVSDFGNGDNGVWMGFNASNTLLLDNVISGNGKNGVKMEDSGNNTLKNNSIGTDAGGTQDVGNTLNGVHIVDASNNQVGTAGLGNLISGNDSNGVRIEGTTASNNLVQSNFIGTKGNGTEALKNSGSGVMILAGAFFNTVGGTAAGTGNIISGNGGAGVLIYQATQNQVEGNYIGTDLNGTMAVANSGAGVIIQDADQNTIGAAGTGALGRNVISGNAFGGIRITGSAATQNKVQNNYIGTDKLGDAALGNDRFGIFIDHASSNTIGGTIDNEGNVISGNGANPANGEEGHGIVLKAADFNVIQGNYIGTKANGTDPLGNLRNGVDLFLQSDNNTIGGTNATVRNVISANGWSGDGFYGISIAKFSTGNTIDFNYVGVDKDGNQNPLLKNKAGWMLDEDTGNTWGTNNKHQ
jgi:parallel beta-helix repeat protein